MEVFSTKEFLTGENPKDYSQEASTLRLRPGYRPDEMQLVHETGEKTDFFLYHTEMQAFENEVLYWVYRPYDRSLPDTVTVWND